MMRPAMLPDLSTDLDDPDAQPYFIWDVPVTVRELRELLHHGDEATRALWTGRVLREARYAESGGSSRSTRWSHASMSCGGISVAGVGSGSS